MKKAKLIIVLFLISSFNITHFSAQSLDNNQIEQYNSGYQFQDSALEQMIRNALGIPADQVIDESQLQNIYSLSFTTQNSQSINRLDDLIAMPNLSFIEIKNDEGQSMSHLLSLFNNEAISSKIVNLYIHDLSSTVDFSFLLNLTHLQYLSIINVPNSINEVDLSVLDKLDNVSINNASNALYQMAFTAKSSIFLSVGQLIQFNETGEYINLPDIVDVGVVDLTNFTKLANLGISGIQISNTNEIGQIDTLTQLTLNHLALDTSFLPQLSNLYTLELFNVQLNNLDDISNMNHLIQLYLKNNQLTSLDGIEKMTQLDTLVVNHNPITQFEPIHTLNNLVMLDFSLMSLSDLSFLEFVNSQPTIIGLSYNSIFDLSPIENYPNLSNSLILLSSQRMYLDDVELGAETQLPQLTDFYQRTLTIKSYSEYYQNDIHYAFTQNENTITWSIKGENHLFLSPYAYIFYEAWMGDKVAFSVELIQNVIVKDPVTPDNKEDNNNTDNTDNKEDNNNTDNTDNKEDNNNTDNPGNKDDKDQSNDTVQEVIEDTTKTPTVNETTQTKLPSTGLSSDGFTYASFTIIIGLFLLLKHKKS